MRFRTLPITWIVVVALLVIASSVFVWFSQEAPTTAAQLDETFTLTMHSNLNHGITSCDMGIANVFDLTAFGLTPPVIIDQVRFFGQSFPGSPASNVTVHLFADYDGIPSNGAQLIHTTQPTLVGGDEAAAHLVNTNRPSA